MYVCMYLSIYIYTIYTHTCILVHVAHILYYGVATMCKLPELSGLFSGKDLTIWCAYKLLPTHSSGSSATIDRQENEITRANHKLKTNNILSSARYSTCSARLWSPDTSISNVRIVSYR